MRMPTDDSQIGRSVGPERGSATLVVFILLSILVALIVANSVTLHHLRGELRLIHDHGGSRVKAVRCHAEGPA